MQTAPITNPNFRTPSVVSSRVVPTRKHDKQTGTFALQKTMVVTFAMLFAITRHGSRKTAYLNAQTNRFSATQKQLPTLPPIPRSTVTRTTPPLHPQSIEGCLPPDEMIPRTPLTNHPPNIMPMTPPGMTTIPNMPNFLKHPRSPLLVNIRPRTLLPGALIGKATRK